MYRNRYHAIHLWLGAITTNPWWASLLPQSVLAELWFVARSMRASAAIKNTKLSLPLFVID
jgi:hypothetical protein